MAHLPTPPAQPDDNPERYVGLARAEAERTAAEHGWQTVRALPPGAIITMEFLQGRLNFEVKDDTVTRCWVG
ncbi:I78 family peptidase inhibitor [Streptomyces sp. NPDC004111]|uniref:I78 family peptidase inhibitor n=1 Tax=Streptomyces sp. NPDC004111 TaxID=3364690 RepID=UPI003698A413